MTNIFLIADTHWGHENAWKTFQHHLGGPLRPFSSTEEMDEAMVTNWNNTVGPQDKVYHLGDVAMSKRHLTTLGRLNGTKVLIKGNHDNFPLNLLMPYFKDIRAYHHLDKILMSHVPIHPSSFPRFKGNIHGHTHDRRVMKANQYTAGEHVDPKYFCVSVEQINYTPIYFEEVRKHFKE